MKWARKKNERAVSPVIAVILMVAITVVLAAVLYVTVQELVKDGEKFIVPPATSIEKVGSGWKVSIEKGTVPIDGAVYYVESETGEISADASNITHNNFNGDDAINAGDTLFIDDPSHNLDGDHFKIVYDEQVLTNIKL